MSARPVRVLVEFTQDTLDAAGEVVRSKGERLLVDPVSARSFVEKKKVAKVVTDEPAVEQVSAGDVDG